MSIFTHAPATWTNDTPIPNAATFNLEIHEKMDDINTAVGTIKKGVVAAVQIAAGDTWTGFVSFGMTFASTPIVVACPYNPSYVTTYSGVSVTPSTTGFTIWVTNLGAGEGSIGISWIAIGTI